jgi:large subunit ribosomal protein L9
MAKTEVILTHNIIGLGGESDQVKVAAGYARNYLFPQGLAIPLTAANKRRLEALRQRRGEREALELNAMTELAKSLSKMQLTIKVKTGEDGKMFGSVTAGTIADELKSQFEVALDKRKIHLEKPVRSLGDHEIEMRLYADVVTTLKLKVESSTPPPAAAVVVATEVSKGGKEAPGKGKPEARPERVERKPRVTK